MHFNQILQLQELSYEVTPSQLSGRCGKLAITQPQPRDAPGYQPSAISWYYFVPPLRLYQAKWRQSPRQRCIPSHELGEPALRTQRRPVTRRALSMLLWHPKRTYSSRWPAKQKPFADVPELKTTYFAIFTINSTNSTQSWSYQWNTCCFCSVLDLTSGGDIDFDP